MKKKLIRLLLPLGLFLLIFLVWPYYAPDVGGYNCPFDADCGPSYTMKPGGGFKYIANRIQLKTEDSSNGRNNFHFAHDGGYNDEGYFKPITAFIASLTVGALSVALVLTNRRIKTILE